VFGGEDIGDVGPGPIAERFREISIEKARRSAI
jgi:hypothetical protein